MKPRSSFFRHFALPSILVIFSTAYAQTGSLNEAIDAPDSPAPVPRMKSCDSTQ
jgi:hypothetical protein